MDVKKEVIHKCLSDGGNSGGNTDLIMQLFLQFRYIKSKTVAKLND